MRKVFYILPFVLSLASSISANAEKVQWGLLQPASTDYTMQGPTDWTRIATFRFNKQLPYGQSQVKCSFMLDVETEQPYSVYAGLWIAGQNWASGAHAGALKRDEGINGLVVITFSSILAANLLPAGPIDIDIMAAAIGNQIATFQRRYWYVECAEDTTPVGILQLVWW